MLRELLTRLILFTSAAGLARLCWACNPDLLVPVLHAHEWKHAWSPTAFPHASCVEEAGEGAHKVAKPLTSL